MQRSQPQVGQHIDDPDAHWRQRARDAAYGAGLSPERIVQLLKQHFPNDPNVDLLYQQPPLFQPQSEKDIGETIERSLQSSVIGRKS